MANYTTQEKNQLTIQYEPLINKLTAQFFHEVACSWDDIKSMAYEGFALALNKYDEERSDMTFMSFAAFEIRNNIMTRLTEESRTVKLPFEEQKRRKENGLPLFNSVSIDHSCHGEDEDLKPREIVCTKELSSMTAISSDISSLAWRRSSLSANVKCSI